MQKFKIDFISTKSIDIKINNDLYKVQYQRGERGDTDKNVWFANVISKNNEEIEGRLCFEDFMGAWIYGFSLKEVENIIWDVYRDNNLYLFIEDDYGNEKEIIHIEFSEKSKYEKGGEFDLDNEDIRFEQGGELDKIEKIKNILYKAFPYLNDLEFIGKGLNGYAFLTTIDNDFWVVKYTKSITEFWLTKMAIISNPPNVVEFKEAKELSNNYDYGIIHKWVDRDGVPNKNAWNVAVGIGFQEYKNKLKDLPKKEIDYVGKIAVKLTKEVEDYFGVSIDSNNDNWGYNEKNKLVLFDIDGNINKKKYEDWLRTHSVKNNKVELKNGGRTISQTPATKKDQVQGSDTNKKSSSKNLSSAKLIKFDEKTLGAIKNKVKEHNAEHPDKKINLASAKAVVRRGMGAYSSSHRPTISGGKPNSRVAWGLARLNAFTYKIVNGKSKSGKYTQDDDLIEELGYKVADYKNGGEMKKDIRCINCGWEWNKKDSEAFDMYVCHKCGFDNTSFYNSDPINQLLKGGRLNSVKGVSPDYLKMFLGN
jgi:hypothetical protein